MPVKRGVRTVFYGLCGEGLGHFFRAAFLIPRLVDEGYAVEVFTSGRVADLCQERLKNCRVHRVPGIRMHYRNNTLHLPVTILNYARAAIQGPLGSSVVIRQARRCRLAAIISDYEFFVTVAGWMLQVPVIAFDHQQVATECEIDTRASSELSFNLLCLSNKMTYFRPTSRILTSFFAAPFRKHRRQKHKAIIAPVLRPEVLQRRPVSGKHILVYQTSRTMECLSAILDALPGEKRVYGIGQNLSGQPEQPFNDKSFLDDLASCRFALVNGGHTTLSEALYFGKPMICFPVKGQAEQEINAYYVAKLNYGMSYRNDTKDNIPDFSSFFQQEDRFRETVQSNGKRCGNDDLVDFVLTRLKPPIRIP